MISWVRPMLLPRIHRESLVLGLCCSWWTYRDMPGWTAAGRRRSHMHIIIIIIIFILYFTTPAKRKLLRRTRVKNWGWVCVCVCERACVRTCLGISLCKVQCCSEAFPQTRVKAQREWLWLNAGSRLNRVRERKKKKGKEKKNYQWVPILIWQSS